MSVVGQVRCVAATADVCGEGAVWHAAEQALYWTDINRFLIHRLSATDNRVTTWRFGEPVTALTLTDNDDLLAVILGSGAILWSPQSDTRERLCFSLTDWPAVRCNDARADPRGSLWIGSMANNVHPDGSPGSVEGTRGTLFRFDPDGRVTEWKHGIGIANTLVWNPECTRFYTADTLKNAIYQYEYDRHSGQIRNEQPFFCDFARGLPDGSALDSEGYLWNCRYGGGCIVRVAPDGRLDRVVEMPVENVTTCTFGGRDLQTLYVTTAAPSSASVDHLPGGLFTLETSVRGQSENRFELCDAALSRIAST
jgi:sugar lactone lactonase YvrE